MASQVTPETNTGNQTLNVRRSIFKDKKKLVIVITVLLLLCCGCFTVLGVIGMNLPPELKLASSATTEWESNDPTVNIRFNCTNAQKMTMNTTELTEQGIKDICGTKGYVVNLNDGDNAIKFTAENNKGDSTSLEIKVRFDQTAYNERKLKEDQERARLQKDEDARKEQQRLEEEQRIAEENARKQAEANKPKEGDVISGLGRKEIEETYKQQKDLSDLKGSQYAESIKGQKVIWVGRVSKVDNELFGTGYQITMKMGGYTVDITDTARSYGDLNEGQLIKVSATIDKLVDVFGGVTIYLKSPTIEVL